MRKFSFLILILIFSGFSFAQTNSKTLNCKIAVIDTNIFSDKEKGIKKLVKAENYLGYIEHFAEHSLSERINNLAEEIRYLQSQNKPINEKYAELQKLNLELESVKKEKIAEYKRKHKAVVEPVLNGIKEKFIEFSKSNGYALIFDKSQGTVIVENDSVEDITEKFIQFCNESFEKEGLR